jgi:hypothetical protein
MEKIKKSTAGKPMYGGVEYASREEIYFRWFCNDLVKSGHIKHFVYQPDSMVLIPKAKYWWTKQNKKSVTDREGNLMDSLGYTADFLITWSKKGVKKYVYVLNMENISVRSKNRKPFVAIRDKDYPDDSLVSYIDVKGNFGQHGDAVKFPVLQKIIYFTKGIYVEKIVPEKLFKKTFYPSRYIWTDGLTKKRKI